MHPKFSSIQQLLEFFGDGKNGLLKYIKNVERACGSTSEQVQQQNVTTSFLRDHIDDLVKSYTEADKKWHSAIEKYIHESAIAAKAQESLRNVQQQLNSQSQDHSRLLHNPHLLQQLHAIEL